MSINMLIEYDMVMVCILKDFKIPLIMENPLMWVHQLEILILIFIVSNK